MLACTLYLFLFDHEIMKATVNPEYVLKANITRWLCLTSYLVQIILLYLVTHVFLPEDKTANTVVFAVLALPLLPFFPFIILRNIKAHAWLMFSTLFYFTLVAVNVFDPNYGFISQLELGNIIILFCTSMMFTRYEQRRLGITITPKDNKP